MNNLCYAFVLDGEASKAIAACEGALRLQPDLVAAHNNLGLAHAVNGDLPAARAAFAGTGDLTTGLYNIGIVYMAQRDYSGAVDAFQSAHVARPTMTSATARAGQARVAKARGGE
jgi:Flp pilus assembly protein TadD